jgi:modulator of FtsH protease HflC
MKKTVTILVVIAIVVIIFLLLGPFYIVQEGEQAVVVRFGEIVSSTTEPGLRIKTPIVDTVVKYPARIMSWDGEPRRFPTQEQQFIFVDTTARWRISDPELFYARITTIQAAYGRLDQFIETEVRKVIARNPIYEAVRSSNLINEITREQIPVAAEEADNSATEQFADLIITVEEQDAIQKGRARLSEEMLRAAATAAADSGIELIDVVIRQIRYSDELTQSVYDRMVSERQRIASAYRSLGEGRREEILGQLEREKARILSEAYATSEQIRGEADAVAAETYSAAYQQDPDFFEFWRAIESYRQTLPSFNKTLTTDMDYFNYLYSEDGR